MSNSSTKFFSLENDNRRHIGASVQRQRDHEEKIIIFDIPKHEHMRFSLSNNLKNGEKQLLKNHMFAANIFPTDSQTPKTLKNSRKKIIFTPPEKYAGIYTDTMFRSL